jgi:hypothetical protein
MAPQPQADDADGKLVHGLLPFQGGNAADAVLCTLTLTEFATWIETCMTSG